MTTNKPKVYIVNKGYHDYSAATGFGEIIYLSEDPIPRMAVGQMMREFYPVLNNSSPRDYIIVGGMSTMAAIACAIFAERHHRLNLLLWSGTSNEYAIRSLIIPREDNPCE